MKNVFPIFALGLVTLQICSCSPADKAEGSAPERPNQLAADAQNSEPTDEVGANPEQPNPYEGIPVNQPVMHRDGAGEPGSDGWCLAKPTRGNFRVMLPGKFTDSLLKLNSKTGGIAVMHTVMTQTPEGTEFNVLQTEIIGERPAGLAAELMIDDLKKKGAAVTRANVVVANLPAVKLRATAEGVAAEFILISTPKNEYMLAVQSPGGKLDRSDLQRDIERFFQSFEITRGEE